MPEATSNRPRRRPAKPQEAAPAPATPAVTTATTAVSTDTTPVEKSAIYRINADNTVDTLWSSKEENVYDILPGAGWPGLLRH